MNKAPIASRIAVSRMTSSEFRHSGRQPAGWLRRFPLAHDAGYFPDNAWKAKTGTVGKSRSGHRLSFKIKNGQGDRKNITAKTDPLPIQIEPANRLLTAAEFQKLADAPPEVEWFANLRVTVTL